MATKEEIIDSLSQCGGLSYTKMVQFVDSVFFGNDLEVENLAPQTDEEIFD